MQPVMERKYRRLTAEEVAQLERQGNRADDWGTVLVREPFDAVCVQGNRFGGEVRIGALSQQPAEADGLREGIYDSTIVDTTIGDHARVHDVRMLRGYTVGDGVTLSCIDEISADGAPAPWLEPMNENGGRRIKASPGMTVGMAYLWARYRGRKAMQERLEGFAEAGGPLATIGDHSTIRNTSTVRNVAVLSRPDDPTTIDTCTALTDGVVGTGCRLEFGVIAHRFLLGEHVHLEDGLRLNDTVVGDNSRLARGEVGSSIIFPAHEQHHNNSFLIASLVMGQSNVAAGATIGSNHNSRTADGELAAGRGFWPGLCCSFKHPSRFASFCLVAKADYPAELDVRLPFALVSNNAREDRLEVMPGYWWMYNMYAMDRNSRKFAARDKRSVKKQNIEFESLAPDTAEEILHGMELLRGWMAASSAGTVYADGMEKSKRKTVVLKAAEGLKAYEEMLVYYAMKHLTALGEGLPSAPASVERAWVNIGGQLVGRKDMERLIAAVEKGEVKDWKGLNMRLDELWRQYPEERDAHAYDVLCRLAGVEELDERLWEGYRARYEEIKEYVARQVKASRQKDNENRFRRMMCWDEDEWQAVMGS